MARRLLLMMLIVLLAGCIAKTGVSVDAGASNYSSSGRILFSQPF